MKRPNAESQYHGTPYTYPAPVRGWVESDNPALAQPGGASVLENFLPTETGVRVRGGCQDVTQVPAQVTSMFAFDDGTTRKFFTATATNIYDASLMDGSPATSVKGGLLSGNWSTVQFTTSGQTYLYAVNGANAPILFSATSQQDVTATSTPIAITGKTGPWSHVWAFKSRIFLVKANSMEVNFLPVGSVGGAAADLNLQGVFQLGGTILFGATWSSDSGSGFGDRCVIVTDKGEVAIYEGTDPSVAASWNLVGRYVIAPPLGKNAHVRVGGDLLIATTAGLVPISGVVTKDPIALETIAISRPIARSWRTGVSQSPTGWTMVRWDNAGILLVLRPNDRKTAWGVNASTGAWFKIVGWDMGKAAMHRGKLYFGGDDGAVRQADTTGQDGGSPIVARYRGLLEAAPRGGLKTASLARATFVTSLDLKFGLRIVGQEKIEFPTPPTPWTPVSTEGLWDSGVWNKMIWDSATQEFFTEESMWRAQGVTSTKLAAEVQVVSDDLLPIACELISVDAIIKPGGVVG